MLTYVQRFTEAVTLIVGKEPPEKLVRDWINGVDYENCNDLQQWVGKSGGPWWAQNIAVLDACKAMADNPIEGEPEIIDYEEGTTT